MNTKQPLHLCLWAILCILFLLPACKKKAYHAQAPIDEVDPFVGTAAHGHTYPGATYPNGMVQLSPDTRRLGWDACSGYYDEDEYCYGFSHTHLSGTGCIDFGDILFAPYLSSTDSLQRWEKSYYRLQMNRSSRQASPGYFHLELRDEESGASCLVSLTAALRRGMHKYQFQANAPRRVLVSLEHLLGKEHDAGDARLLSCDMRHDDPYTISGYRVVDSWARGRAVYFAARFSEPILEVHRLQPVGLEPACKNALVLLDFKKGQEQPLYINVALSFVSEEAAIKELYGEDEQGAETDSSLFAQTLADTQQAWVKKLETIQIEGGSEKERKNFYTALYHCFLSPNLISDADGRFPLAAGDVQASSFPTYSTLSLWDTFRSWHPLMTLIDTELNLNIIRSMLHFYKDSGELPIWPLAAKETRTMIGYHSVAVIAEAYMKGERDFNAEEALEAMIRSSNINAKGSEAYMKYGYIPSDLYAESVSSTLEFAYDDFCIAKMAAAMGRQDLAEEYMERAGSYERLFDGKTRFFRGRKRDGNFDPLFSADAVAAPYTEATAWHYRFFVPHDVARLTYLMGGREKMLSALDSLFSVKVQMQDSLSDISGLLGRYAHGNEPSHHMAYLYTYLGEGWKTQEIVRQLLDEMYEPTPEGLCGNEDCGQMSAWYVMSALGLYPVSPVSTEYVLCAPLFTQARLKLANGRELSIKANASRENKYIQAVYFNNNKLDKSYIRHHQLMQGGELRFELGSTPNKKRDKKLSLPSSMSKEPLLPPMPYVDKDVSLIADSTEVQIGSTDPQVVLQYRYQPEGEAAPPYQAVEGPVLLSKNGVLSARAQKKDVGYGPELRLRVRVAEFMPPQKVKRPQQGLQRLVIRQSVKAAAELRLLSMSPREEVENISLPDSLTADFGLVFSGYFLAKEKGVYLFETVSDDGSLLYIGDQLVVENDGSHSMRSMIGAIALEPGYHPLSLYYYQGTGEQGLRCSMKAPSDGGLRAIPDSLLFR